MRYWMYIFSRHKNETLFVFFKAIITTRNGWDGTHFYIRNRVVSSIITCRATGLSTSLFLTERRCSSTSHSFILRLSLVYWSTLKITNDFPIFASYLQICYCFSHLLGLLSVTWIDYLSSINSLDCFIYFLFLSDEETMLETLDYSIRIGSTPTFLYFDLYLYSAYTAHCV